MNLGNWIDKRGQILDDNTKSRQLRESMGLDSKYNADTEVYIVSLSLSESDFVCRLTN